jgi:hypothetical protein
MLSLKEKETSPVWVLSNVLPDYKQGYDTHAPDDGQLT